MIGLWYQRWEGVARAGRKGTWEGGGEQALRSLYRAKNLPECLSTAPLHFIGQSDLITVSHPQRGRAL